MLKQLKPPTVLWDDNSSFTDYTIDALSYGRDSFSLASLSSSDDYLYYGLYKPFNSVYVEMSVPNDSTTTLDIEYYNGTTWTDISNDIDETRGFNRSGFIRWDSNQDDWSTVAVNSTSKYWIRIRPASDFDADCAVQGMNIVYSDDQDLHDEIPSNTLSGFRESNENSYILRHQAARDDIVQEIRNSGKFKDNFSEGLVRQIDVWDFQDLDEIRQWSKYIVLAKIMENLSKDETDIYWSRREEYLKRAGEASNLYYATLDNDDDGILDIEERLATNLKSASIILT